jgi:hypothetical protein
MSENVEILRRLYAEWARGDFGGNRDVLDPDIEWQQHSDAVEPGTRRGPDDVGRMTRNIFAVLDQFRAEAEEFLDAGDQVVVVARIRGAGRASGVELDQRFAFLWTMREGKAVRVAVFHTRPEALEAAGLTGPDGPASWSSPPVSLRPAPTARLPRGPTGGR